MGAVTPEVGFMVLTPPTTTVGSDREVACPMVEPAAEMDVAAGRHVMMGVPFGIKAKADSEQVNSVGGRRSLGHVLTLPLVTTQGSSPLLPRTPSTTHSQ